MTVARSPDPAPDTDPAAPPALACPVQAIETATPAIRIVRLALPEAASFAHKAGQYAQLAFDGFAARDYSIASRPGARVLEFHIRDLGSGPSHYVAQDLQVGEIVGLRGPFGETYLRPEKPGPILALCGSSGLAPMKAIVEEALALGLRRPLRLYIGVRREAEVYLEAHFASLQAAHPNLSVVYVVSEPTASTGRRTGLVTDALAADRDSLAGQVGYLAGPPAMVEAGIRLCRELGMAAADIHADPFD